MHKLLLAVAGIALLTACGGGNRLAGPGGGLMPLLQGAKGAPPSAHITQYDRMTAAHYFSQQGRAGKLKALSMEDRDTLREGQPIPRGINVDRVPGELAEKLLPIPNGYRRVMAGNTLIILDRNKNVVDAEPFFAGVTP